MTIFYQLGYLRFFKIALVASFSENFDTCKLNMSVDTTYMLLFFVCPIVFSFFFNSLRFQATGIVSLGMSLLLLENVF